MSSWLEVAQIEKKGLASCSGKDEKEFNEERPERMGIDKDLVGRENLVSPELGKRGNKAVHLMAVGWGNRPGFPQWRREENACLGLTALPDRPQMPVPGKSTRGWPCVTLAKLLPIPRPQFPHLQKERMSKCNMSGPLPT